METFILVFLDACKLSTFIISHDVTKAVVNHLDNSFKGSITDGQLAVAVNIYGAHIIDRILVKRSYNR